eukprot:2367648-Pyramimonas_sp.AAC.1
MTVAKKVSLVSLCFFLACNGPCQGLAQTLPTTAATKPPPYTPSPPLHDVARAGASPTHPSNTLPNVSTDKQSFHGPNPVVITTLGPIEGIEVTPTLSTYIPTKTTSVHSFRGVPYALPPTGARRFEPAQPIHTPWTGTLRATEFGHTCIQQRVENSDPQGPSQSEDCLFLNIWTPASSSSASSWTSSGSGRSELLPVM